MDRNYFLDTMFDLINESDALEAELLDIHTEDYGLKVTFKDGTRYSIQITDAE